MIEENVKRHMEIMAPGRGRIISIRFAMQP
jgi:hypothetical protein